MKPTDLRGILRYIPSFRDKIFVLSLDGAVVTAENFSVLLQDVAVLRSLNIHVVLVHGASAAIREMAAKEGVEPSSLDGSGITDAATLELALTASNRLTHEILEGIATQDLRAAATNAIVAHPVGILRGVNYLFTGKLEKIDSTFIRTLLNNGIIPVVPPLGLDGEGNTYRVSSEAVAASLAIALRAVKLIFIAPHDGIRFQGELVREIQVAELDRRLQQEPEGFDPETLSKARHGASACHAGVPRVHVINGRVEEGLLAEVFSNEGIGSLIYVNAYRQIRQAEKKDVRTIQRLTKDSVANEELAKRPRAVIESAIDDYYLFELDNNPVGCVALHLYAESRQGELAHLFVSPLHENQGIGQKLVEFVEKKAREKGMKSLVILSTQAFAFFRNKAGFQEGSIDDLPPARRESYKRSRRRSKILKKKL